MTKNSFVLQIMLEPIVAKLSDKQAGVLFSGKKGVDKQTKNLYYKKEVD